MFMKVISDSTELQYTFYVSRIILLKGRVIYLDAMVFINNPVTS